MNYDLRLTGYVGDWEFDASTVREALDKKKDQEVHVLIDSLGGSVATALSIVAEFKNHGNVTVHFVGMNASAATIASMGAKKVCIDTNALYLVHKASMAYFQWASLNADKIEEEIEELRKAQADLNTIDATIAKMYAAKCSKSHEDLLALMKENRWMNAEEAKEWGFVDEIENEEKTKKPRMTEAMALDFVAAAIPMPPVPVENQSILSRLAKAFGFENAAPAAPKQEQPKPVSIMKKFAMLCSLLVINCIELIEGKTTITEAQLDAIEDALTKAKAQAEADKKTIEERDKEIADLRARVEELSKAPAEPSAQVVDEGAQGASENDFVAESLKVAKNTREMLDFFKN